jgi:hypothetical protein
MRYQVINNLPVDFYFSEKSKGQLKLYAEWFFGNKDYRIQQLDNIVKSTINFEDWNADYTVNSLKKLGSWLNKNIITEKLTEEEIRLKRQKVPNYIDIRDFDLTKETYSKLIDVGMYFGEVFIKRNKGLKWEQYFSKIKNDSNQGHIVINGFGKLQLNPIRIAYITGSAMADKKENDNSLYESYENWKSYLK